MTSFRGFAPLAFGLAALVALTACPSQSHRIPKSELYALAQEPPEQRGERVRVVQSLGGADEPPQPAPHVRAGVSVYVVAPLWVDGTPHHHRYRGGGASHGGGVAGGSGRGLARAQKEDAKSWLVIGAIVAGALALTEGIRYDGWVKLHPMQPVHLWGPYGEDTWMPPATVTPGVRTEQRRRGTNA